MSVYQCLNCGVLVPNDQKCACGWPERQAKPNYRPESCHGVISLVIEVPASERSNPANDIAEAYAVETGDDIPGGCIIWGKYRGEWVANVSGRWLISRFLKSK